MKKKIGIFGGSFNPIHFGHLILAQEICFQAKLDKVIFIPAANPPHRVLKKLVPAKHRYQMIKLAIKGNPKLAISDIEINRSGYSYTIDTVKELMAKEPGKNEFYLLVGMDMLADIVHWKCAEELIKIIHFLAAPRVGFTWEVIEERVRRKTRLIKIPYIGISSREIREKIKNGHPVRYWVPEAVLTYIKNKRLYRESS